MVNYQETACSSAFTKRHTSSCSNIGSVKDAYLGHLLHLPHKSGQVVVSENFLGTTGLFFVFIVVTFAWVQ